MAPSDDEFFDLISQEALIDRDKLSRSATLSDIGIDSVDVVTVVFAAEEKWGIEVPEKAFDGVSDLGGFIDILKGLVEKREQAPAS
ncbi:MAG: phosphopantetheine-binding protein [Caulobacteraceae bacterium]